MKHRIIIGILLALAVAGVVGGYSTFEAEKIGLCENKYSWDCYREYGQIYGNPVYLLSLFLTPIFLLLLFLRKEVFFGWLKFGAWFIPLSALLIYVTPVMDTDLITPSKRTVTILLGQGFLVLSLFIIAWKSWRVRRQEKEAGE